MTEQLRTALNDWRSVVEKEIVDHGSHGGHENFESVVNSLDNLEFLETLMFYIEDQAHD